MLNKLNFLRYNKLHLNGLRIIIIIVITSAAIVGNNLLFDFSYNILDLISQSS